MTRVNRRAFMALASGLLVPEHETVQAYSFVGGWTKVVGAPSGAALYVRGGGELVWRTAEGLEITIAEALPFVGVARIPFTGATVSVTS